MLVIELGGSLVSFVYAYAGVAITECCLVLTDR